MGKFFYSLFIPHPSNNHKATILHHQSLAFLIALLFFASFFFPSSLNPFSNKIGAFADISVKELLTYTNQNRESQGLKPLESNAQLEDAAARKAKDMFDKGYWAHNSPDGTTPWSFISSAGYDYVYAGENLARGFNSANEVVKAWMASPDHRANILSANYNDVGFAVAHGNLSGEETFLVVQEFGSKNFVPPSGNILGPPMEKKVLGFSVKQGISNIRSISASSRVAMAILFVILGTLIVDIVFVQKKKIARVSGHSLDHSLFMIALIVIVAIFGLGQII